MAEKEFTCIVIGLGGIGSASLYWLSKRLGSDVLGIEQFTLGHHNGGSQDISRVIRLSYYDEIYTKLGKDAFTAWRTVEDESGIKLVHQTGTLDLGISNSGGEKVVLDSFNALKKFGISAELLNSKQIRQRWPELNIGDDIIGVYEPLGGIVDPENANSVHIQLARRNGAGVIENCPVNGIQPLENGIIKVFTSKVTFVCKHLILATGAWTNSILKTFNAPIQLPITVTQEQVTYFATKLPKQFLFSRFPVVSANMFYNGTQNYYFLPIYKNTFVKVGIDAAGPVVTVESRSFDPDKHREEKCGEFLKKYIPRAFGPFAYTKTCLYALPPDRHLIIDSLNAYGHPNVLLCIGAGQAFKFASLLGKVLSQLALDKETSYDLKPFSLSREAMTNPAYSSSLLLAKPQANL